MTLKTVKYASCRYLDNLPTEGDHGGNKVNSLLINLVRGYWY